jgi:hypothetical protein
MPAENRVPNNAETRASFAAEWRESGAITPRPRSVYSYTVGWRVSCKLHII